MGLCLSSDAPGEKVSTSFDKLLFLSVFNEGECIHSVLHLQKKSTEQMVDQYVIQNDGEASGVWLV